MDTHEKAFIVTVMKCMAVIGSDDDVESLVEMLDLTAARRLGINGDAYYMAGEAFESRIWDDVIFARLGGVDDMQEERKRATRSGFDKASKAYKVNRIALEFCEYGYEFATVFADTISSVLSTPDPLTTQYVLTLARNDSVTRLTNVLEQRDDLQELASAARTFNDVLHEESIILRRELTDSDRLLAERGLAKVTQAMSKIDTEVLARDYAKPLVEWLNDN